MLARIPLTRLGPIAASCMLHVLIVGLTAAMVPVWVTPLPSVLEAQLIEPEPAPVAPAPPAARPVRPPLSAPTTLPRLLEAPKPRTEEPKVLDPPMVPAPPPIVAPAPPAVASREPLPFAVAASEPSATPAELPAAVGRPAPPAATPVPPPAVAKAPPDEGITRLATPTGGYQVRPSYPSTARRLGVEGTTLLRAYVAADGRVTDVQVDQSAGHPDLDRAAADAVRRWKFEPGRRGSEPIGMWVRLPVQFVLK